jgi:adenylate kinase
MADQTIQLREANNDPRLWQGVSVRLLIMGPPGAGKGTQAKYVSHLLGIPAISTGDIFRMNVTHGTTLGLEAQRYMGAGEYVPDEITNGMVRHRLADSDAARGFILDGYPRTIAQADELDSLLAASGHSLDLVVVLTVNLDELVRRLLQRADVQGRSDDTEGVIRRRQRVYVEQTEPLVSLYRDRGICQAVDGTGSVHEIADRLRAVLLESVGRS